ncbi:hypothetical protein D3C71_1727210 [compost metagenome]
MLDQFAKLRRRAFVAAVHFGHQRTVDARLPETGNDVVRNMTLVFKFMAASGDITQQRHKFLADLDSRHSVLRNG